MMDVYGTALGKLLAQRIDELIQKKAHALILGGAQNGDLSSTGAAYIGDVAYIRGLREALKLCQEIEVELRDGDL